MMISDFSLSRIILGMMSLPKWNMKPKQLLDFIEASYDLGINSFDHADIYGDYSSEKLFGKAMRLNPGFRKDLRLISKCGIKLISDKYPKRKVKSYDTSYSHIINSVDQSLLNLKTDYLDVLLIHRPNPFMNPGDTARVLDQLVQQGKVLQVGVSNFRPHEIAMLTSYLKSPLMYNQVQFSLYHPEIMENTDLAYLQFKRIQPMAWSPLAGGKLFDLSDEKSRRIHHVAERIARELGVKDIMLIYLAWIHHHPSKFLSVLGTGNIDRVRSASNVCSVSIPREQLFELYEASRGFPVS